MSVCCSVQNVSNILSNQVHKYIKFLYYSILLIQLNAPNQEEHFVYMQKRVSLINVHGIADTQLPQLQSFITYALKESSLQSMPRTKMMKETK